MFIYLELEDMRAMSYILKQNRAGQFPVIQVTKG